MNRKIRSTYGRGLTRAAIMGLACLLASCLTGHAQSPPDDRPTQVDMHFARFGKPNSQPHSPSNSPGCAVAVIQNGQNGRILYEQGYGMADLEQGVEITPKTIFHAASLTKQFTAMLMMLLVNSGDLDLDDPVDKHITVPIATQHNIKIRHLLGHISGIRDQWVLLTLKGKLLYHEVITQADVLELVSRMESVDFEPGTKLIYSNTGYTLAAEIIKKIVKKKTGQSLSEFARENIFVPLGMNDTSIIEKHDQVPQNSAKGYISIDSSFKPFMPNLDVTGPTNLYTTVEDLARWDRNFDDKTVGGEAALHQMQTKASDNELAPGVKYGLGLQLTTWRGRKVVEHDGRDAGFRSHLIRFPDHDLAVASLCNLALDEQNPPLPLPGRLAREVADIYLGDQPPQPSPPPPDRPRCVASAVDLAELEGTYHSREIDSREIDATYQVQVLQQPGRKLVIKRNGYKDATLEPGSEPGCFNLSNFGLLTTTDVPVGRPIRDGIVKFLGPQGTVAKFALTGNRSIQFPLRIQDFLFEKLP